MNTTSKIANAIDVEAMEWFDKANGNSYFAARITLDYGLPESRTILIPFQYGYGDAYLQAAFEALVQSEGLDPKDGPLWRYCREVGAILRTVKHENCLKRDAQKFGSVDQ